MEPIAGLKVSPGHVAGFGTDVGDIGDQFWSLASTTVNAIELPTGARRLIADLIAPLESFRNTTSDAHQRDREALYKLSGDLSESARSYHGQEHSSEQSLNLFGGNVGAGDTLDETRWGGMQFSERTEGETAVPHARRVAEWAMDVLSLFEPGLTSAAGIRPIADYLDPVACDWEELRPVAAKVGFLGANDTTLSSNIGDGTTWLAQHWSGAGAQSFTETAADFRQQADERADHMQQVASIVRGGGESLEQLTKNQAVGLVADLMRPTTFHGFTMPLGHWGALLDQELPADVRAGIESGIASAKDAAQARHDQIASTLDGIKAVLASAPGSPSNNTASSAPAPLELDYGTAIYSYKGNVVREVSLATPA